MTETVITMPPQLVEEQDLLEHEKEGVTDDISQEGKAGKTTARSRRLFTAPKQTKHHAMEGSEEKFPEISNK